MDNLAKVVELKVHGKEVTPCVRVLRGFFLASRVNNAPFFLQTSYSYNAGGVLVNIPPSRVAVGSTVSEEGQPPEWAELMLPKVHLPVVPDPGAAINATASIVYVLPNGNVIPSSDVDTSAVVPTLV